MSKAVKKQEAAPKRNKETQDESFTGSLASFWKQYSA